MQLSMVPVGRPEKVQSLVLFQRVICEVKVVNAEEVMEFLVVKRCRMFWWGKYWNSKGDSVGEGDWEVGGGW